MYSVLLNNVCDCTEHLTGLSSTKASHWVWPIAFTFLAKVIASSACIYFVSNNVIRSWLLKCSPHPGRQLPLIWRYWKMVFVLYFKVIWSWCIVASSCQELRFCLRFQMLQQSLQSLDQLLSTSIIKAVGLSVIPITPLSPFIFSFICPWACMVYIYAAIVRHCGTWSWNIIISRMWTGSQRA